MSGIETVVAQDTSLNAREVQRWIDKGWVRPRMQAEIYVFDVIDIARIRLIHELSFELRIDELALPVVLNLLDQIHAHRRRLHDLSAAINLLASPDLKQALAQQMLRGQSADS